jgi:hypothetical protein
LHELARLIWLEARLSQGSPRQAAIDLTDLLPEPERCPEGDVVPSQGSPAIDLHGVFRRSELQGRNRE